MPETPQEAFERGTESGRVAQILAEHAAHFAQINGSMGRLAEEMHDLVLGIQQIRDAMASDKATVLATAAALKAADEARRDKDETRWSPWARVFAALGALAALAGVISVIVLIARP